MNIYEPANMQYQLPASSSSYLHMMFFYLNYLEDVYYCRKNPVAANAALLPLWKDGWSTNHFQRPVIMIFRISSQVQVFNI